MELGGGGGGGGRGQACEFFRWEQKKNGVRTPTTFDINDIMRGGGEGGTMKRYNDVIFSKIVWRRPLIQRTVPKVNVLVKRAFHAIGLVRGRFTVWKLFSCSFSSTCSRFCYDVLVL